MEQAGHSESLESVKRLGRDLREAAVTLSDQEARYLVDAYYIMQDDRKRGDSQVLAMGDEPTLIISWLADQSRLLERQIKSALDKYTMSTPRGDWLRSVPGIGPVIAAGLIAHIDIEKCPTVGHLWSFAGLDPSRTWGKGQKRPHNAQLKTLCWKAGQSFMKLSNNEKDFYGHIYKQRKEHEIARNESGEFAEQAREILETKNFRKTTEAYKHYSVGKLPPAHIDARARRWAVKIFLSHLHSVWYEQRYKKAAPEPYALAITGHAHLIPVPTFD